MLEKIIKRFKKSNPINPNTCDEQELYQLYGNCDVFNKNISLIIISDTHGRLREEEFIDFLKNTSYDLCIMLGDHHDNDIQIIKKHIDNTKLVGLLGNHDYNYLNNYNIPDINGKIVTVNGVTILGMQGSYKYKPVDFPSFTQEESILFLENMPKVDILVSHDRKFDPNNQMNNAHQGLKGITRYIYKNKIPYHIHGHIHEDYEDTMINGTKEISVFGYRKIEL